jgi:hypothetical protein
MTLKMINNNYIQYEVGDEDNFDEDDEDEHDNA